MFFGRFVQTRYSCRKFLWNRTEIMKINLSIVCVYEDSATPASSFSLFSFHSIIANCLHVAFLKLFAHTTHFLLNRHASGYIKSCFNPAFCMPSKIQELYDKNRCSIHRFQVRRLSFTEIRQCIESEFRRSNVTH